MEERSFVSPMRSNGSKAGFSLVEVMIAASIGVLCLAMAAGFTIESARTLFDTQNKLNANAEFRILTQRLLSEARNYSDFRLYESSANASSSADQVRADGEGDMLALFKYDVYPSTDIAQVVLYHRETTQNSSGEEEYPLYRTEYTPATPYDLETTSLEKIVANALSLGANVNQRKLATTTQGLENGSLFLNLRNKTIVLNGQFIGGNNHREISDANQFAISPRG